jgi:hypothetical protein
VYQLVIGYGRFRHVVMGRVLFEVTSSLIPPSTTLIISQVFYTIVVTQPTSRVIHSSSIFYQVKGQVK